MTVWGIFTRILQDDQDRPEDEYRAKVSKERDKRWSGEFPPGKRATRFYNDDSDHRFGIMAPGVD